MENKSLPHKHPFMECDKWSKVEKELNDAEKDYLTEETLALMIEKFELTPEQKEWVQDGFNYKKAMSTEDSEVERFISKNKDFSEYFVEFEKRMEIELKEQERSLLRKVIGDHFERPVLATVNKDKIVEELFSDFCDMFEQRGEFIALYFGAHWSPQCRKFTYDLHHELYGEINKNSKIIEVIFVSDDRTTAAFQNNIQRGSLVKGTVDNA